MPAKLAKDSYGKSGVRVTKVTRNGPRHELAEFEVAVALEGDFAHTYLTGDNTGVVATDSMKNTVYVIAKNHPCDSPESFAIALAEHFVKTYPQVSAAQAEVVQTAWQRVDHNGKPHDHAFVSGGNERRRGFARLDRSDNRWTLEGGLSDLLVLKTTNSEFVGYLRDQYTTLKETSDRIFATSVSADWVYNERNARWNDEFAAIRKALLDIFAEHMSLSVQQTLYAMGERALDAAKSIRSIGIRMPNKHRLLVNLEPFKLANDNEVFVWTDEPYGDIYGLIERDK